MKNDRAVTNIFDLDSGRYPHLKITLEDLPRVLATRRIEDDNAEYFGAFLTKTAVRILIDFVNRVFRLRGCELELDGTWQIPCTQYYRKRCVAPCVSKLCSGDEYGQIANLVRLFIADQRSLFTSAVNKIISEHSEKLDFERAAKYRDILLTVEKFWQEPRWRVWLDDAVDTYAVEDTPDGTSIFLVTHRGRNVLGRKVFTVDRYDAESSDIALAKIIGSFYETHLPREIRVSRDFVGRHTLENELSNRFGRQCKIFVSIKGVNAIRGLHRNRDEHELDKVKPLATPEIISAKLKIIFGLHKRPSRVEAFDVAHISGTGFVAVSSVWIDGHFTSEEYRFHISDLTSELGTLAHAVVSRLADRERLKPDLILLDGGISQLSAVLKAFEVRSYLPPIIAAVKPPSRHSSIASFLSESNDPVPFDVDSPAHAMLQLLRDEAHSLANRIHRDYREMKPFYEHLGYPEPVIVPVRYHAENGGAEDLIPIETR